MLRSQVQVLVTASFFSKDSYLTISTNDNVLISAQKVRVLILTILAKLMVLRDQRLRGRHYNGKLLFLSRKELLVDALA
jgi:hypothetical protein